jgi:hypothetical protein
MADRERRPTKITRVTGPDGGTTGQRGRYDTNPSVETAPAGMVDNWAGSSRNTGGSSSRQPSGAPADRPSSNAVAGQQQSHG